MEAVKIWVIAAVANTCETSASGSRAFCTVLLLMCPCIVCTQLGEVVIWTLLEEAPGPEHMTALMLNIRA